MFIKNSIENKNKYNILKGILALILVLGSVFSVTFAYIFGSKSVDDDPSDVPFLDGKIFYNVSNELTGSLESPSITGSINASGVVTLNIAGVTLTANPGENINLPLSIKNAGNIDAELVELSVMLDITGSDSQFVSNYKNTTGYYLTINTNTTNGYTITDNAFIENDAVTFTKNSGNSSEFITSISVDSEIASSNLVNSTFTISIQLGIGQIGIGDLD